MPPATGSEHIFDIEREKHKIFSDFPALRDNLFILGHAPNTQEKDRMFTTVRDRHGPLQRQHEKQLDFILTQAQQGRAAIVGLSSPQENVPPFAVLTAGAPDTRLPQDGLYGFFAHFGLKTPPDIRPVMVTQSRLDHELGHVLTVPRLNRMFNTASMGVRVSMPLKQERAADAFAALRHSTARYGENSRFPALFADLRLMSVILGVAHADYYTTPAIDHACDPRLRLPAQDIATVALGSTRAVDEPEYTKTALQQAGTRFHFAKASAQVNDIVTAAAELALEGAPNTSALAQRVLTAVTRLAPGQYDPPLMRRAALAATR